MIKTLDNFEIGDLLSDSLKKDKNIAALAYALTPIFQKVYSQTQLVQMFEGIPDHLLDFVAFEEAAEFYDVNMTNEQKRLIIANSESIHKTKGTVAAIEDVIAPFFPKGKVREWFEYGGDPYHFHIYANEYLKNEQDIVKLFRMVNTVKRQSTRFERVFFNWKNDVPVQAVEGNNNIQIHPFTGALLCGQWPEASTLGRFIEAGTITMQRDSFYKVDSTYRYPGFFANSEERLELLKKEFESIIQLESAPTDYSNIEFLMANESLMVGKFRTGSTELFEGNIHISIESSLTIGSENYTAAQEELARAGQFFLGSKAELEKIQKEYLQIIEIGMSKDISFIEYMETREDLKMNFLVGSKETFEQYTRSMSSSIEVTDDENTITRNYKLTGQFYAGEVE